MAEEPIVPQGPSFQLGDIYYTLFRHKWKILTCWLAGLAVAFAVHQLSPAPYMSEAKLFIKYVVTEGSRVGPGHDDSMVRTAVDQRGDSIIKSELEILNSLDLAEEVAKSIGADKILGSSSKPPTDFGAALVIQQGLVPEVLPNSSVIRVSFSHPNPEIAQLVLRELIAFYLKRHVEVHMAAGGVADAMSQEKDQLRAQLAQTEEELRKVMSGAGIISLEDSKKSFSDQFVRIRQQLFDAQTELAGRLSVLQETTQAPSDGATADPSEKQEAPVPPEQLAAYQKVATHLALLQRREQDYLGYGFSEESSRVKEVAAQIAESQVLKKKLETDFPALARVQVVVPNSTNQAAQTGTAAYSPQVEMAQIASLKARINALEGQQAEVRADAARVDNLEASILELRRRKELEETNYRNIAASLESSRIDEAIGSGRAPNIIQIETPTPPLKNSKKIHKLLAGIVVGGFALGLAWAFAIELFLDRSVRRPADIERTLRLPLFLSIPLLSGKQAKLASTNVPRLPGPATGKDSELARITEGADLALTPYYETLRDRLISYFDTLNVRHKPKLVAVTGLGKDTGVTTLAAGLARSFSETGEGNVLLVDMTQGQGSAQHFHKGATVVGLEELLDTKQSAQVQDNLYVVSENSNSDRLAKGMPQRFNQLIPKLKASDFDYIIFDMPPINQISVTPRLASFMDMMLLVIESEKTDRDVALQASAMLAKSKAPVGVILNKTKTYIPPSLHQDRESLLGG